MKLVHQTEQHLRYYLNTNQSHREQMCRAILACDPRFSEVLSRHPNGGPDGGRDIEAIFRREQQAFAAVGFLNDANDSEPQKTKIRKKFKDDVQNALKVNPKPEVFVFLTNVRLTVGNKDSMISQAKAAGFTTCEVWDRERLKIALDSPDGFSIRFQYLGLPMSEAEQASFFAKWGDDIQSVISTGFQKVDKTLERVLFLQETTNVMSYLVLTFELDRTYAADEIGHFRAFCSMFLKEPKHQILQILFGSSDKPDRMRTDRRTDFTSQQAGIKHGVSGGRWEQHVPVDEADEDESMAGVNKDELSKYKQVGTSSSVGMENVKFLSIEYNHDSSFIRFSPRMALRDIDQAHFLPVLNKSLAEKVKCIHVYANEYKVLEIPSSDFRIDTDFRLDIPVKFTDDELADRWVRIQPDIASAFRISFADQTPRRMYSPRQTPNNVPGKSHRDQP